MAIEVQLNLATESFLFARLFETVPSAHLELDRVVPVGEDHDIVPFVWIETTDDPEAVAGMLGDIDGVSDVEIVHSTADQHLFRLQWAAPSAGLLEGIRRNEGALLSGYAEGDRWSLTLRFADHDALSGFSAFCRDNDIRFDLARVTGFGGSPIHEDVLTAAQREALELAVERGYFAVPRAVSLDDLADALGVSHQAYSERLRRAIERLATSYLASAPSASEQ
ncbi:helix-turn-helix domain-containing protein [Halomarina rubra]|uniref:Helix-turn-helix domain-containing protein n=1 Tax=Halomarina rubra TaxID=2071873 RepID=A0ABD6ARU0_9EURY|nr:helix-turn-helix domain-containing protein [Halomarina rubra]